MEHIERQETEMGKHVGKAARDRNREKKHIERDKCLSFFANAVLVCSFVICCWLRSDVPVLSHMFHHMKK